jgi:aldehyde:ferredoxin oxidoreductase
LYFDRNDTCFACPIACGKTMRLPPEKGGLRWKMPEYETLFSLGSMVDNWDPASLLHLNSLCDQLGLDTISMGVTLAFAAECMETGWVRRPQSSSMTTKGTGPSAVLDSP